MLDNVELVMYMKFQKILMTGCRDIVILLLKNCYNIKPNKNIIVIKISMIVSEKQGYHHLQCISKETHIEACNVRDIWG